LQRKYNFENGFIHLYENSADSGIIFDFRFTLEDPVNFKIYGMPEDCRVFKIVLEPGEKKYLCCHSIKAGKFSYSSFGDVCVLDPTKEYFSDNEDPPVKGYAAGNKK
jgi:hypothetical protein